MGNAVVHFEIGGPDDQPLVAFYGELFGWGLRTSPTGNYTLVDTRSGGGINGGISKSRTGEPWSSFYVESAEPTETTPPGPSAGDRAPVDWFEVLGSDAQRTQRFYSELFGWTVDESGPPGYRLVDTGAGRGIQGGLGSGTEARWATVYASVPDVEKTLARAEELGGSRV